MSRILATSLKPGVSILLTIIVMIVVIGLIVLLIWSTGRERRRYINEKHRLGDLTPDAFDDMIKRRISSAGKGTRFCVLAIEINDAKNMKEAFGEKQYNTALSIFMERMEKCIQGSSKICLRAYDRISVFINEDLDKQMLTNLLDFLIAEGRKQINLMARVRFSFDFNIGAANYDSQYGNDYEQFRQNVESALVSSRRSGLNQYVIYSPDLMSGETEEYKYYKEIKQAIEDNEFTLYYQPIQDIKNDKLFGFEALLRWNHKTLGVLPPSKFLNIMEQTGDILWVGYWAFEQIVIAMDKIIKDKPGDDVIISMNLSPKQLMNDKLVENLMRIIKKHHVPTGRICLEIVEFAMFDTIAEVSQNIAKLEQLGFIMAIDDFGVDISSIKTLESVKCNYIKLGREFIEKSQDDFLIGGIASAIVGYAEKGGKFVVAEGIEDETVLQFVKSLKIPLGQGYFFGKPQPLSAYGY